MPAMPRPSNKARKIAYDIMGEPINMRKLKNHGQKKEKSQDYSKGAYEDTFYNQRTRSK